MLSMMSYCEFLLLVFCFLFIIIFGTGRTANGVPRSWTLFGMLPGLSLNVHRIHDWCTDVLGRTSGTFMFKGPIFANMDMLVTVDPSNVHYIMSSHFSNFPKGPKFREIFDMLGDGIFNADAELWKTQRTVAQSHINHPSFNRFLVKTSQNKVEKGLVPILDHVSSKGEVIDFQDMFQRFTFDTTCMLVTGYDPGCLSIDLPNVPFSKAMDDAEETVFHRHVVPEFFWKLQRSLGFGQEKKLREARIILDKTIAKYIAMKRDEAKVEEVEELGVDLLASYMANDELGLKHDDKFLRDTILNFMIAGRDTTSSALTWFLWLVSTHPHVEEKIRQELEQVTRKKEGGLFAVEEVKKLVYLHAAICEALRLYPPVPFQHKEPVKGTTLPSGHWVHPKMKILFSLYAMGRMKFIWGEDSSDFKPERWISERGTIRHEPSYKFLAFNAGPRTCLGKEVAFTQVKVVAANIIHNYNVQVVEGHQISPNVSIILYMKYGLKVRVSRRYTH